MKRCTSRSCLGQKTRLSHCQEWLYQWALLSEYHVLESSDWVRFSFPPLSASSNHPCWHLETAKRHGPQRKRYLSGQRGDMGLFYTPSLHLIHYLCSLAGRYIFFLPIFLSSVIPKKLQGSFTLIWIATFYLLLLKIKRKAHYGFSGCPMLLSGREQE